MPVSLSAVVAVASVGAWLVLMLGVWLLTRPTTVAADPASPELGPEPPAVVHLLANRWRLTAEAAEATLLDLAARRILEVRQAGSDPRDTTIHLRPDDPGKLLPYEELVLTRVRELAVDGVVPVATLSFRSRSSAWAWRDRFRRLVVTHARRRRLSRPRVNGDVTATLYAGAVLAGLSAGWHGGIEYGPRAGFAWWGAAVMVMFVLLIWTRGERDTPAGIVAAARWLALRDWLRAHEQFGDLPPAAVTVWDRYLSYGLALGVAPASGAVLDLGMGDRRRVWSSYGGRWRRVRVRYPRLRPHLGRPYGWLIALSGVVIGAGAAIVPATIAGLARDPAAAGWTWLVLGGTACGYGLYVLFRMLGERGRSHELDGEVLWVRPWRRNWVRGLLEERSPIPVWLYYLAVDDGTGERTTAWGLPAEWTHRVVAGDTVRIAVRPWSRRTTELEVRRPGPRRERPRHARQVPAQRGKGPNRKSRRRGR